MSAEQRSVLVLGASPGSTPHFSADELTNMLNQQIEQGKAEGLAIEVLLVTPPKPSLDGLVAKLREKQWHVVAIGWGVRASRDWTELFENMVNLSAHEVRPIPKFAFHANPDSVVEAVKRVL